MNSNRAAELGQSISRRAAIGFGVASGWALGNLSTEDVLAKVPLVAS